MLNAAKSRGESFLTYSSWRLDLTWGFKDCGLVRQCVTHLRLYSGHLAWAKDGLEQGGAKGAGVA